MKVTIPLSFALEGEPLRDRRCARCKGANVRAILDFEGRETWAAGELRRSTVYGSDQSPTSIALCICGDCHRIASLM